ATDWSLAVLRRWSHAGCAAVAHSSVRTICRRDHVGLCFVVDGESAFEITLENGRESHAIASHLVSHSLAFYVEDSHRGGAGSHAHALPNLHVRRGGFVCGLAVRHEPRARINSEKQRGNFQKCSFHVLPPYYLTQRFLSKRLKIFPLARFVAEFFPSPRSKWSPNYL